MSIFSTIILAVAMLSLCLWISMLITKIKPSIAMILNISIATVLVSFIPVVGIPLAMVALLFLISKLTDTKLWPKSVLATAITFVLLRAVVLLGNYAYKAAQAPGPP
jgi:hypothetical protein